MAQEVLVERDVEGGRQLIQALDRAGFPVVAALWKFLPDEGEWRLLIASPRVQQLGPLEVYRVIQEELIKHHIDIPLHRVSAVDLHEPLVSELRIYAGTDPAPSIGGTYLQKVVIGDLYLEGAYVYRAERIIGYSGSFEIWLASLDRGRKVWIARRARVTLEDGLFKKLEVEGFDWPQTHARAGLNTHLEVVTNVELREGQVLGDVDKWTVLGGRLRSVETVARQVPVEGYPVSPPASQPQV